MVAKCCTLNGQIRCTLFDRKCCILLDRSHLKGDGVQGSSDKVKLSKFRLVKGDKFLYLFDYGDEWRFQIKVLNVVDEPTKTPIVLKSVGTVIQYEGFEDDWDDEFDDEAD